MFGRTPLARKALTGFALASIAALALTACNSGTSSGGSSSGEIAVTLITKTNTNQFFIAMQKGAEEAGQKDGVKITTAAGTADGDTDTQVKAIEDAIARGDKGILITPNGPGVNDAINNARDKGLYVIALDTPPDPADTVDITFATDNFKAGELIGKWTAAQLNGQAATIAMLDLFNDKIVSVDVNRDQGFLSGMGIPLNDKGKNGDESPTGKYTGGKGGSYTIACNEPTQGATDGGQKAMEDCLQKNPNINVVYTINEPAAAGAANALGSKKALIVSVDGGCNPGLQLVKAGTIGATSQQYPVKMAELGVEAIKTIAEGGAKPQVTPGLTFYDTGVALVTDKKVAGLDSISVAEGDKICWGS